MASPTEAVVNTQLQNAIALLDNLLTTQTVATDEDTYVQSLESDFASSQSAGARLFRARVASAISSGSAVLSPVLTTFAHHVVGVPERSPQAAIDRIYQDFIDNNKSVLSRRITYGTPSAFSAGQGTLYRVTEDENGFDIESLFLDIKTVKVIADENTGADRYEEVFEFRGANAGVDSLGATGSGGVRRDFKAKTHAQSILKNPGFNEVSIVGTVAVGTPYNLVASDTITGWTLADPTNYKLDADDVPLTDGIVGETLPRSLHMETNDNFSQTFAENRISLVATVPYFYELWVLPTTGTTAGTLTISWGSKSQAFDLFADLTVGSWNRVKIDQDRDLWPSQFIEPNAIVNHAVTGLTGGTGVKFYGVTFTQMQAFDGTWYHISTGITKFELDDLVTVSDSLTATDSKINLWLWRVYARYLPHFFNATQVVASGGRTLTFADANPDTVTASSGDFVADGYVVGQQLTVAGTASNNGTFTIAAVAATVITVLSTDTFLAEGPLSGGETLDGGPTLTDPA